VSDTKYDQLLKEFLEADARDRADGNTIANLRLEVHQSRLDISELGAEVRMHRLRLDRHGKDLRELKAYVYQREDEFDTGVHQVQDLKRHLAAKEEELRERRDSGIWWRRKKREWVVAGAGALLAGLVGIVGWFLSHALGGK
jgi:chromosome segregation ATPase